MHAGIIVESEEVRLVLIMDKGRLLLTGVHRGRGESISRECEAGTGRLRVKLVYSIAWNHLPPWFRKLLHN